MLCLGDMSQPHSRGDVGHHIPPPWGPSSLLFYHRSILQPILFSLGLQWCTQGFQIGSSFASLLDLYPQEKTSILHFKSLLYIVLHYLLFRRHETPHDICF